MQTTEFNHALFEEATSETSEVSNIDNHELEEETELDDMLCEDDCFYSFNKDGVSTFSTLEEEDYLSYEITNLRKQFNVHTREERVNHYGDWGSRKRAFEEQKESFDTQFNEAGTQIINVSVDKCIPGYSCENIKEYSASEEFNYFTNTELERIQREKDIDSVRYILSTFGPFFNGNETFVLDSIKKYIEYIPIEYIVYIFQRASNHIGSEPSESQKAYARDVITTIYLGKKIEEPTTPKVLRECLEIALGMPRFNMWLLKTLFKLGVKCTSEQYSIEVNKKRSPAFLRLLQEHCEMKVESKPESKQESKVDVKSNSPLKHVDKESTKVFFQMTWKTGSFSFDITSGHTTIKQDEHGVYKLNVTLD